MGGDIVDGNMLSGQCGMDIHSYVHAQHVEMARVHTSRCSIKINDHIRPTYNKMKTCPLQLMGRKCICRLILEGFWLLIVPKPQPKTLSWRFWMFYTWWIVMDKSRLWPSKMDIHRKILEQFKQLGNLVLTWRSTLYALSLSKVSVVPESMITPPSPLESIIKASIGMKSCCPLRLMPCNPT